MSVTYLVLSLLSNYFLTSYHRIVWVRRDIKDHLIIILLMFYHFVNYSARSVLCICFLPAGQFYYFEIGPV